MRGPRETRGKERERDRVRVSGLPRGSVTESENQDGGSRLD